MEEIKFYLKSDTVINLSRLEKIIKLILNTSPYIEASSDYVKIQINQKDLVKILSSYSAIKSDLHTKKLLLLIVPFFSKEIEKFLSKKDDGIFYLYELIDFNSKGDTSYFINMLESISVDIITTIKLYINLNQSVIETSEVLFTHRNTINYRINRFIKLTQIDIRQYTNALLISNLICAKERE